jgi:hypothetical protein
MVQRMSDMRTARLALISRLSSSGWKASIRDQSPM